MESATVVGCIVGIAMFGFARWLAPDGARLPQIPALQVLVAGLVVFLIALIGLSVYGPFDTWLREVMGSRPRLYFFRVGAAMSLATFGVLLVVHGTSRIMRGRT